MLEQLTRMFVGKTVDVTHTNLRVKPGTGICTAIHKIPGTEGDYDMEFEDGSRTGFVPEVVTDTYVDGPLNAFAGGRRKIEIR